MVSNTMKVLLVGVCLLSLQQVAPYFATWDECNLDCGASPDWFYSGMVLSGGTFLTIPNIEAAPRCQFLCAIIPDCQFWTQDTEDNTCDLKNLDTDEMTAEYKEGAYSGIQCVDRNNNMIGGIAYGVDFQGADIRNYQVQDEAACQQECMNNSGDCRYWTYDIVSKECYQKEKYGWTIQKKTIDISGASPA